MKNNLMVINHNGQWVVDSREVAKMVGKRHDHLLRDIKIYADVLEINPILGTSNFFIKNTYLDTYGRRKPCYLLTKKGCDMVANKMTGEKGILFTATYVTKFEEMERQIKQQVRQDSYVIEDPIARAKRWIEEEETRILLEAKVQEVEEVIRVQAPKVQKYNEFLEADGTMSVESFAKAFSVRDGNKKIGRNSMFKLLKEELGILTKSNVPTQKYLNKGFFEVVCKKLNNGQIVAVTRVTPLGADRLMDIISKHLAEKAKEKASIR